MKAETISVGDHIFVRRWFYTHHGIFVGRDEVIHFDSSKRTKANAKLTRTSLSAFAAGASISVVDYRNCDPLDVVLGRAEKLLAEAGCRTGCDYSLFLNNCEHFATYCKTGKAESEQVNAAGRYGLAGAIGAAVGPYAARTGGAGLIAAVTPVSLPVMIGLALAGGFLSGMAAQGQRALWAIWVDLRQGGLIHIPSSVWFPLTTHGG